ncbi:MAG: hypothetical protein AAGC70_19340 [Pseudomonadota bacterium]
MVELIVPLATGAAGGLVGGNILGALFRLGFGTGSLIGLIGGALAVQFFGPEFGPQLSDLAGSAYSAADDLAPGTVIGNLIIGAGGGSVLSLVIGGLRSIFVRG